MDKNIFHDFESNRQYTTEVLDGISMGVSLFAVSDQLTFLHFNRAADEMFGYEKGGLLFLTQKDPLSIFHPDYVDNLYSEIIASMRDGRLFNYDCRVLCEDGGYRWTNLSAELVQKDGGRLCFYGVLSPIEAPRHTLLKGCHCLACVGNEPDRHILTSHIEELGGTCDRAESGLEALDFFAASDPNGYCCIFLDSHLPGMNGFELAKEIRHFQRPDSETVPLILLISDDDDAETIQTAREMGIDLFFKKPLDQTLLHSLLSKLSKRIE